MALLRLRVFHDKCTACEVERHAHENSADGFVSIIERELADKVVAIYAGGSFARGDYTLGRSDVD
ncbi:MAG: nucleotidyltransferase domain-containing protein [Crenarchaeota archaeon]|nr:nucleotidyltransferase domain-containing protein [Thermoproteota archaeon]